MLQNRILSRVLTTHIGLHGISDLYKHHYYGKLVFVICYLHLNLYECRIYMFIYTFS